MAAWISTAGGVCWEALDERLHIGVARVRLRAHAHRPQHLGRGARPLARLLEGLALVGRDASREQALALDPANAAGLALVPRIREVLTEYLSQHGYAAEGAATASGCR